MSKSGVFVIEKEKKRKKKCRVEEHRQESEFERRK
jgi:hypothetical protein